MSGDKNYEEIVELKMQLEMQRLHEMLKLDPDQFKEFLVQETQRFRMEMQAKSAAGGTCKHHLLEEEKPDELTFQRRHHESHKSFQVLDYFSWSGNKQKIIKVD